MYDIAFGRGKDEFATVGADGSVRMFDLRYAPAAPHSVSPHPMASYSHCNLLDCIVRSLDHSTIMYESPGLTPLLRLEWNSMDSNYLATIIMDSPKTIIIDIRYGGSQ